MKYEEEGKGVNMCRALRELLEEEWEKGEKQGIEQNTYSFIISMHEENIELDKICRICGKTEEEVRQIIEKH